MCCLFDIVPACRSRVQMFAIIYLCAVSEAACVRANFVLVANTLLNSPLCTCTNLAIESVLDPGFISGGGKGGLLPPPPKNWFAPPPP